jgi:hypothetical protein
VNRLAVSRHCLICGLDLYANWHVATLVRMRIEWNRMMNNGMCDGCQHKRLVAAVEYEQAANLMALVVSMGAGWTRMASSQPQPHPALAGATRRIRTADARCVELLMWPTERAAYREESNDHDPDHGAHRLHRRRPADRR